MDQVEIVRRSLRCFVAGLIGLVPVLGLPAAIVALLEFRAVTIGREGDWNPAGRYLVLGCVLAGLGLLADLLLFGLVMLALLQYLSA